MMTRTRNMGFWIRLFVFVVFLGFIFIFGFIKTKDLIAGIDIKIEDIQDGDTIYDSPIQIKGSAEHATFLSLNGYPILIDTEGNFNETLLLPEGYSIIELKALDTFGKEKIKTLRLFYPGKKNEPPSTLPPEEDITIRAETQIEVEDETELLINTQ